MSARRGRKARLSTGPFRLWSAFVLVAFVLSLFAARLIQLQGIDENDYAQLAVEKGATTIDLEAPRASIYDRNGTPMARSVDASMLTADPTYTKAHAKAIATYLHHRLGLDYIETLGLLEKKDTRYVQLARHLKPEIAQAVVDTLEKRKLAGVYVDKDTTRVYPAHDIASNLIGFVGADGDGLAGFEASQNSLMSGHDGSATFEMVDGQQLPLADTTVVEPREGTGVRLTIDQDLQFLAQRRLAEAVRESGGKSGTAVVLDVKTGQILALADDPTYDPNHFERYPKSRYVAPSVQSPYEPGSVEKVLTFASLIDAGKVTPRTHITVPASLPSSDAVIHDWWTHGRIHLTATGAIAQSSNIATALAARQLAPERLRDYLVKFGLGSVAGVGLNGESSGVLPPADKWLQITRDNIAFGQGLSVTAVQMAAAVGAVANGGVYVAPQLVDGYVGADGSFTHAAAPEQHRVVSAKAAHDVARMMEQVVGPDGLAPMAAIDGYNVAGKTGTAQRVDPSCGCYRGDKVVSFAGFAPADAPRFLVYVVVQQPHEGWGGGTTGGPVFHDLMAAALAKYGVPPTGRHEPALPVTW
jgi:cell division protein FtsI (penicillin-binding protein 3)